MSVRLVPPGAIFKAPMGRIKPEIPWSPPDFTPCFLLPFPARYLGLAGLSLRRRRRRHFLCCLVASSSPLFASSHLQSLILRPPHIFLPLLDVCNPLILFISHALGSSLSSSTTVASFSHLHLLLPFPSLPFLPHYYFSVSSAIHPFSPLIAAIHHSLSSSSHYYPVSFSFFFFLLRPLPSLLWPFFPLQLSSSWLLSPFICPSNIICPLLVPSSSAFSFLLPLIPLYSLVCRLREVLHGLMFTFFQQESTLLIMFLLGVVNAGVPGSPG